MGALIYFLISHMQFWAAAVIAYFCGCFNGAVIVSKYILRDDVRGHGSGNAGLTNFYRTFGGPLTFVVILTDVLKAVVAVLVGVWLTGQLLPIGSGAAQTTATALAEYWSGLFCLLGLVLILTVNQKITYTPENFTYRDMLRISHTYSYSQIKKIRCGKDVTIHVGHRIILIDQMAGNGKKFAHIARMHAPDAEFLTPEQAKLFGGNVYNPGEFVFIFILIGLIPVAAALFLLHLDRAVSPKDLYQETCTVTSYQFTENDDGDKRLELELPGYTAAFYTWGIEPDSAKMAQIEQEIADKVTFIMSFPKSDQNKKDLIPIIQLESADHVYLSLANYNHDTLKARNELILLSGGFEVLWLLSVLVFSYVVRHADKYPKLVRLFVKPSYLIDKSDMK